MSKYILVEFMVSDQKREDIQSYSALIGDLSKYVCVRVLCYVFAYFRDLHNAYHTHTHCVVGQCLN